MTHSQTGEGRRERPPRPAGRLPPLGGTLYTGSSSLCSPRSHSRTCPAGTGTPGRWSWSSASPLPDLLEAGRGSVTGAWTLSCPPATSRSGHRLSTCTHLQTSPLPSGCLRRSCGRPSNLGWGQRATCSDTLQINLSACFPRKITTALLGVAREQSLPASLGGYALRAAKGCVLGSHPHLTSMRLFPQGQLSAPT